MECQKTIAKQGVRLPLFTRYKFHGSEYLDFASILTALPLATEGKEGRVQIRPGRFDVTRWARVRKQFGGSKLRTHGDEPFDGILHDWRKTQGSKADLFIRAHVKDPLPT